MLLTISTTHFPATDLGYLLHKNPANVNSFNLSFGKAHLFYTEVSSERCTAALLLDVDQVGLVRGRSDNARGTLAQYVNDRGYVASSFLSVAIAQVLGSGMNGRSRERQELADSAIPLEATVHVIPCSGGADLLRALFEPLGYRVEAEAIPLDDTYPEWGTSRYYRLKLSAKVRLADLLTHLYVLIAALDSRKHYYIGDDEVEKLISKGGSWLTSHPQREMIVKRYLKNQRSLVREALAQLVQDEEPEFPENIDTDVISEESIERKVSLHELRLNAVVDELISVEAESVLDLGCGEGKLLALLLKNPRFKRILGMDVSCAALEYAAKRLHLDTLPESRLKRISLIQGSLTYSDKRLQGFDAAAVVEVVEHLEPSRLEAFQHAVFHSAKPRVVIVTTPNAEYNALFETLPAGEMRHKDHRFEWSREEFQNWAEMVAEQSGYRVRVKPIGIEDDVVGAASQMAVFERI